MNKNPGRGCQTLLQLGEVASLDAVQQAGQLGCFGLTEKLAGVNSGMVVGTTATCAPRSSVLKLFLTLSVTP